MRFIGSKAALTNQILKFIHNKINNFHSIGDLFCGTAIVSATFKKAGYSVIANDNLNFCTTLAKAILLNNEEPVFSNLMKIKKIATAKCNTLFETPYDKVISFLNDIEPIKDFIYTEYSPEGTKGKEYSRLYFSNNNARKIDAIREKIKQWEEEKLINEAERALLISDLINATNNVANIAGTYGYFLKRMEDPRTKKTLKLSRSEIITAGKNSHQVFQMDANILIKKIDCDIIYLDPPYNWRHYGAYYHILETISRWDKPKIKGKSGLRNWQDTKSKYCYKDKALSALMDLLNNSNSKHIFLSYNSEGLISHEEILKNISYFGKTDFIEFKHQRYKSNNGGSGETRIIERIYYVAKRD